MIYNLLCLVAWGVADLFYKMGNNDDKDKNSYLKTGAIVGFVMGAHAIIYMIINRLTINFVDIIKYLPISFCYILSMVLGYKGLEELKKNYNLNFKERGWFDVSDKIEGVCDGDIKDLKYKPELVDGYQLQNIEEYYNYLLSSEREKDKARIPLVEEYINNHNNK